MTYIIGTFPSGLNVMHQRINLKVLNMNNCWWLVTGSQGALRSLWLKRGPDVKPPDIHRSVTKHSSPRNPRQAGRQVALSHSAASSRRQPRQRPWIKDGSVAAATEDPEIGHFDLFADLQWVIQTFDFLPSSEWGMIEPVKVKLPFPWPA